ncbi:hypothetical protein IQ260_14725 [Leptolyngbya cf. ectocarpi LEGE 11479]|uniref:Uncharacterized protein n=1 Tax=Leptolyngbya cf. ectocarpi LEGE 11479 TaxID=1828722 RepID=A0A928ZV18_LEPEC|nr:hypothetical protein [Leptolyngbya ectocarpi]MBE9067905.1 hypothetical protein [Leptolyngbya cf. ectocarpi LEGE 11479]
MSQLSKLLKDRFEKQGKTKYALAKAMAEADGTGKSATNFTSKVTNTLEAPEARVFRGVKEMVELLGGEIVIRWKDEKVVRSKTEITEEVID